MRRRTFLQWWHESGPGRLTREDGGDIGGAVAIGVLLFVALLVVRAFEN